MLRRPKTGSRLPVFFLLAISSGACWLTGCRMSPEQKIVAFVSGDDALRREMSRALVEDLDPVEIQALVARCQPAPSCARSLDVILTDLWRPEQKYEGDRALQRVRCTAAIQTMAATQRLGRVLAESGEALERQVALTALTVRPLDELTSAYKATVADGKANYGLSTAIAARGGEALSQLTAELGISSWVEDPLARMGKASAGTLTQKLRAKDSAVRFAAADALVLMNTYEPGAVVSLSAALDSRDLTTIARQYAFYIRLGRSGSERVLLQALSRHFSESMCVDYLNCGNDELAEGARRIARQRGYEVSSMFGSHGGPRWGQVR